MRGAARFESFLGEDECACSELDICSAFCQRTADVCSKYVPVQQLRHRVSVPSHWRNDEDALFRITVVHQKPTSFLLSSHETQALPSKRLETLLMADRCVRHARPRA